MKRPIGDLSSLSGFEVPEGMDGRVDGMWANILAVRACRDCVAMEACVIRTDGTAKYDFYEPSHGPTLDKTTEAMVQQMVGVVQDGTEAANLYGAACDDPHKQYYVVGGMHCSAEFSILDALPPGANEAQI